MLTKKDSSSLQNSSQEQKSRKNRLPKISLWKDSRKNLARNPFLRIKSKPLRLLAELAIGAALFSACWLALLKADTENSNAAIDNVMVAYFTAMDKQDYSGMRPLLYPTDNEDYLLATMIKAKAIGMESIRLQKIYPAMVDGDLAIVGFETSTSSHYKGEDLTLREANTFFFRRSHGKWYIAKPSDLSDIPAEKISGMIDAYKSTIRENIGSGLAERQEYNEAAFAKLKGRETQ